MEAKQVVNRINASKRQPIIRVALAALALAAVVASFPILQGLLTSGPATSASPSAAGPSATATMDPSFASIVPSQPPPTPTQSPTQRTTPTPTETAPPTATSLFVSGLTQLAGQGEGLCGLGGCAYFVALQRTDGQHGLLEWELAIDAREARLQAGALNIGIAGEPPLIPSGMYAVDTRAMVRSDICSPDCALIYELSSCETVIDVPNGTPAAAIDIRFAKDECVVSAAIPPLGPGIATWRLDPDGTADPRWLDVLVTEQSCASARSAIGRIGAPIIDYTETTVTITMFVLPLPGGQFCPANPETPFRFDLSEPIGDRELVDGGARPTP